MSYTLIDGKSIAFEVRQELKKETRELKKDGIVPSLSVILVGNNEASESYVRGKIKASNEVGINSRLIRYEESISESELLKAIYKLNQDKSVHGILVQLPLPKHISPAKVMRSIDPNKDVDGFHPVNIGKLILGEPAFIPCTPFGILELLRRSQISIEGKHVVVVGRSNIVGKPISYLMQQNNATVTMCHSYTEDISFYTIQADILIASVGKPKFIKYKDVKQGAVVIDVGINRVDGKLVGDVDFENVAPICSHITPVPKGVGPMTISMLLKNTILAAKYGGN